MLLWSQTLTIKSNLILCQLVKHLWHNSGCRDIGKKKKDDMYDGRRMEIVRVPMLNKRLVPSKGRYLKKWIIVIIIFWMKFFFEASTLFLSSVFLSSLFTVFSVSLLRLSSLFDFSSLGLSVMLVLPLISFLRYIAALSVSFVKFSSLWYVMISKLVLMITRQLEMMESSCEEFLTKAVLQKDYLEAQLDAASTENLGSIKTQQLGSSSGILLAKEMQKVKFLDNGLIALPTHKATTSWENRRKWKLEEADYLNNKERKEHENSSMQAILHPLLQWIRGMDSL